jgi:hypothetical protein
MALRQLHRISTNIVTNIEVLRLLHRISTNIVTNIGVASVAPLDLGKLGIRSVF